MAGSGRDGRRSAAPLTLRGRARPLRGGAARRRSRRRSRRSSRSSRSSRSRRTSSASAPSSTWRARATSSARAAAARPTAPSASASASPRSIPARSNLLFERFLSAERREPPDIDVDFEHERREEVIQEIYETLRARSRRDGLRGHLLPREERAARGRQGLRLLARAGRAARRRRDVVGRRLDAVERVAPPRDRLRRATIRACASTVALARAIQGFPRHLSIHVGGFVLSAAPLDEVAPDRAGDDGGSHGHPVGQGRHRHARLLQGRRARPRHAHRDPQVPRPRADAAQRPTTRPARARHRHRAARARSPPRIPSVYDALCQRRHGRRLPDREPRADGDAPAPHAARASTISSIEVAIVRPGPIQGGMVHPVPAAAQRRGERTIRRIRCLAPILERTLGVPLFQEQVMQIAIVGAGYTRRRGRSAPPRHGRVARRRLARAAPRAPARRLSRARHLRASSASSSTSRSRASASTAFPSASSERRRSSTRHRADASRSRTSSTDA